VTNDAMKVQYENGVLKHSWIHSMQPPKHAEIQSQQPLQQSSQHSPHFLQQSSLLFKIMFI
jgi:hypothetical protein